MKQEVVESILKFNHQNVDIGSIPDLICIYRADQKGVHVMLVTGAAHLFFVPDDSIQGLLDVCDAAGLSVRVS